MKKVLAIAAVTLATLGTGTAFAGTDDYPPSAGLFSITPSTVEPGGDVTASVTECDPGETVTFMIEGGDSDSATCDEDGTATVVLTAPEAPGTYDVTATGLTSGMTATVTLTVVAAATGGGLPATGSDSNEQLWIAGGVVLAGLGLVAVSWYRRRPAAAT